MGRITKRATNGRFYLSGDGIYSDWGMPEKFFGDDVDRLGEMEDFLTNCVSGRVSVKLDEGAFMPHRAHRYDAGLDLFAREDATVPAHGSAIFDTGVHVALPVKTVGLIKSKSGLNVNHDLAGEGVIDTGYTGSIKVKLYNHGNNDYFIRCGDKISQLVILPIELPYLYAVDELEETERGNNGFGSTGR